MATFQAYTPETARHEAEQQLKRAKPVSSGPSDFETGCGSAGCLFVLSFCSLLIPVIGPFVFVFLLLAAVVAGLKGTAGGLGGLVAPAVDSKELAGLTYRLQQQAHGPCPICSGEIILPICDQPTVTMCPCCRTNLYHHWLEVQPAG